MKTNEAIREQSWKRLLDEMDEREAEVYDQSLGANAEWKAIHRECSEVLATLAEKELQPLKPSLAAWNRIESSITNPSQSLPAAEKPVSTPWRAPWYVRSWKVWATAACLSLLVNLYQAVQPTEIPVANSPESDPDRPSESGIATTSAQQASKLDPENPSSPARATSPAALQSPSNPALRNNALTEIAILENRKRELEHQIDYVERELLRYVENTESVLGLTSKTIDRANKASVVVMNSPEQDHIEYPSGIWSYLRSLRETPGVSLAFASERARKYLSLVSESTEAPAEKLSATIVEPSRENAFGPSLAPNLDDSSRREVAFQEGIAEVTLDDVVSAYAFALFNEETKQAFISARNVPQPQYGEQYQLWARDGATREFVNVGYVPQFVDTDSLELAAVLPEGVTQVDAWMMTAEAANTNPQSPQGKVVFRSESASPQPQP